jgi:hypothetical protein
MDTRFKSDETNPSKNPEVQQRKAFTVAHRFRKESHNQNEEVKKKKRESLKLHYGDLGYKHPSIIEKRKQTCMLKYGVDNPMKVKEFKERKDYSYRQQWDTNFNFN